VSIVAFDDVPWMSMVEPPISAVRQPVADMSRSAAELILRRLREGNQGPPSTVVLRTEFVERASVAPPRPGKAPKVSAT
jgi:LacI family transcriptional regulator